ncbi:MAG: hypothetical protein AAF502_17165 [Bacteroidota bacterium]
MNDVEVIDLFKNDNVFETKTVRGSSGWAILILVLLVTGIAIILFGLWRKSSKVLMSQKKECPGESK